ncbi:MAG: hypothetical protein IPN70_04125 [Candidatus Moraniibacteriota bacterium]|nr:MAG: hypothetical protein IPN70_04125 [Candidatus Moranbacteria bacterium]
MTNTNDTTQLDEQQRSQRIDSLRDMITSAEKTIQSAKAMLLQLEGKKKVGRRHKIEGFDDGTTIVQGTFDGQIMFGTDGKQYPVPANYASKSKLVEGDFLKLTITGEGSFIYKQVGPVERRHALGIVMQDETGNYYVIANGRPFRVLLASVTYFRAEPGDEAAIVLPRDIDSSWGAIENIVAKAKERPIVLDRDSPIFQQTQQPQPQPAYKTYRKEPEEDVYDDEEEEISSAEEISFSSDSHTNTTDEEVADTTSSLELLEEWKKDIEKIEEELRKNPENDSEQK